MMAPDESECHNNKINNISSFCALLLFAEFFSLDQAIWEAAVLARKLQLLLADILNLINANNYILSQILRALSRCF